MSKKQAPPAMVREWHEWHQDNLQAICRTNPRDAAQMGFEAGWFAAFETVLDLRLENDRKKSFSRGGGLVVKDYEEEFLNNP